MAGYSGMDDGIRTIGCRLLAARSWLLSWAAWLLKTCEIVLKGLNTKNLHKNTCLFVFLGNVGRVLGHFASVFDLRWATLSLSLAMLELSWAVLGLSLPRALSQKDP